MKKRKLNLRVPPSEPDTSRVMKKLVLMASLVPTTFLALWLFPWPLVLLSVVWAVSRGAKVNLRLSFVGVRAEFSGELPGAVAALP